MLREGEATQKRLRFTPQLRGRYFPIYDANDAEPAIRVCTATFDDLQAKRPSKEVSSARRRATRRRRVLAVGPQTLKIALF